MHRDRDVDLAEPLPTNESDLVHDLDLDTLIAAMAGGDELVARVSRQTVLSGLSDIADIEYRQHVLADCVENPEVVRQLYDLAVNAVREEHQMFWFVHRSSPRGMMAQSPQVIGMFVTYLKRLRRIASESAGGFESEGWRAFFDVVRRELDAAYFSVVEENLALLKFKDGVLISARMGPANNGIDYVLRDPRHTKQLLRERLGLGGRRSYAFEIAPRDEAGSQALAELMNRGVNTSANALTQSADHISSFFTMLRTELAFYVGCLNLRDRLKAIGAPTCAPAPRPWSPPALSFTGLYDVCLALRRGERVTGNDADADAKTLIIVTGANSGGKSTFLRSLGVATLMTRSGMFVAAERFSSSVANALFTHFVREEDVTMTSGKLDEELARMSSIADALTPGSVVLFNESFSATNEREGSEIARQVLRALLDADVRAVAVTHLYDLAEGLYRNEPTSTLFLHATRQSGDERSFKLVEGEPLPTSYGEDVYHRLGGWTR